MIHTCKVFDFAVSKYQLMDMIKYPFFSMIKMKINK